MTLPTQLSQEVEEAIESKCFKSLGNILGTTLIDSNLEEEFFNLKSIEKGQTLLMAAVACNEKSWIDFLILCGSKIDEKDNQGKTVFNYSEDQEVQKKLRSMEWFQTETMDRAIWLGFVYSDFRGILKLISEETVNFRRDIDGTTALLAACYQGKPKLVKLLLDLGADPKCKDKNGSTPMAITFEKPEKSLKEGVDCRNILREELIPLCPHGDLALDPKETGGDLICKECGEVLEKGLLFSFESSGKGVLKVDQMEVTKVLRGKVMEFKRIYEETLRNREERKVLAPKEAMEILKLWRETTKTTYESFKEECREHLIKNEVLPSIQVFTEKESEFELEMEFG